MSPENALALSHDRSSAPTILRGLHHQADGCWERFARAYPGDPLAQLCAWLEEMARHLAEPDERGCALANAAIELPEKDHPARRVIEEYKRAHRTRLTRLSEEAGLSEPEMLADELHLLLEGARVTAQSVGTEGLAARLLHMGKAMIAAHTPRRRSGRRGLTKTLGLTILPPNARHRDSA